MTDYLARNELDLTSGATDPEAAALTVRKIDGAIVDWQANGGVASKAFTLNGQAVTARIYPSGQVLLTIPNSAAHPAAGVTQTVGTIDFTLWDGVNESGVATATLQVNAGDPAEAPYGVAIMPEAFDDSAATGATVATATVDAGYAHTPVSFALADPSGHFQVDANTGAVSYSSTPSVGTYPVTLTVTGNNGAQVNEPFTLQVTAAAGAAPTVSQTNPTEGQVGVPVDQLLGTQFSEPIQAGTGSVTIRNATDNVVIETMVIPDDLGTGPGQVEISGRWLTVRPSSDLPTGKSIERIIGANAIESQAGGVYGGGTASFTTVASTGGGTGGGTGSGGFAVTNPPDVVVSSVSALQAQLAAWAGNWGGTVPAGKSVNDQRCIGVDVPLSGFVLQNLNFPEIVWIRPTGAYSDHANTVPFSGSWRFLNCTRVAFWRAHLKSTDAANNGMLEIQNCTECGHFGSFFEGQSVNFLTARPITSFAFQFSGGNNGCFAEHYRADYVFSAWRAIRNNTNLRIRSGQHRFVSDDDMNTGGQFVSNAGNRSGTPTLTDGLIVEAVYGARMRNLNPGNHGDFFQINKGGGISNFQFRYNVALLGELVRVPGETHDLSAQGFLHHDANTDTFDASNVGNGIGSYQHNLMAFGNKWAIRAVSRPNGSARSTVEYNTCLRPYLQGVDEANEPGAVITGRAVGDRNVQTMYSAGNPSIANGQEGPNGQTYEIAKVAAQASWNQMLTDMNDYPRNVNGTYNFLWDIRPKVSSPHHPGFATPASRVGAFELWERLFARNPDQLLSEFGWPHAAAWKADYDPNDNFGSSHSGSYDADGNNA